MKSYVSLDIDGILNDYPACWVNFINQQTGLSLSTKKEAEEHLGEKEYRRLKDLYRTSGYKETLEPLREAFEFCIELQKQNPIIVSTSRPIHNPAYPNLYSITRNWLEKHGLKVEQLLYKETNQGFLSKIPALHFHIDDDIKYAEFFADNGIKCYLLVKAGQQIKSHPLIIPFKDFTDLRRQITL